MIKNKFALIGFVILMVGLGSSDSLKGIFSPIFQNHYNLNASQLSYIVTTSYIGNLLFLLVGGRLIDKVSKKKAMLFTITIWLFALILFISTDNYFILLIGIFLAMGSSTLLNTTINILTPMLFATSPGLIVNFLFFTQGTGTSVSQSLVGNFASGIFDWKLVNIILLILGITAFNIIFFSKIPESKSETKVLDKSYSITKNPYFVYLILLFGLYFIAEHGIMNWFVSYSTNGLKIGLGKSSNYLAIFFGGITLGRLVLSPLVDKLGIFKSIKIFGAIASAFYIFAILLGSSALWLLSLSGVFFSIIYPTLVMSIQKLYPANVVSSASGLVISLASLFDIIFNFGFGKFVDAFGYKLSFLIMPVSMLSFILVYFRFYNTLSKNSYLK